MHCQFMCKRQSFFNFKIIRIKFGNWYNKLKYNFQQDRQKPVYLISINTRLRMRWTGVMQRGTSDKVTKAYNK